VIDATWCKLKIEKLFVRHLLRVNQIVEAWTDGRRAQAPFPVHFRQKLTSAAAAMATRRNGMNGRAGEVCGMEVAGAILKAFSRRQAHT